MKVADAICQALYAEGNTGCRRHNGAIHRPPCGRIGGTRWHVHFLHAAGARRFRHLRRLRPSMRKSRRCLHRCRAGGRQRHCGTGQQRGRFDSRSFLRRSQRSLRGYERPNEGNSVPRPVLSHQQMGRHHPGRLANQHHHQARVHASAHRPARPGGDRHALRPFIDGRGTVRIFPGVEPSESPERRRPRSDRHRRAADRGCPKSISLCRRRCAGLRSER